MLLALILLWYPHTVKKEIFYPPEFKIKQVIHLCIILFAYYFNAFYLVPRWLLKKQYLGFAFAIILFLFIASFFMSCVSRFLDLHNKLPFSNIPSIWTRLYLDRFATWTTLIVLGISTLLSIMSKWNEDSNRIERLEREKIQSELSILRAQIHPHFLFNTLNTVYALSFVDEEASRKVLTKMSRLLRYQLYEIQGAETTLAKEIEFISDYVDIMKWRLNEKIKVALELPHIVNDLKIAPMILICYIENVFKHGVDHEASGSMSIIIRQHEKTLSLITKNKTASKSHMLEDQNSVGIGMQNARRRLELLYPGCHHISTKIDLVNNEFELQLILQLI